MLFVNIGEDRYINVNQIISVDVEYAGESVKSYMIKMSNDDVHTANNNSEFHNWFWKHHCDV